MGRPVLPNPSRRQRLRNAIKRAKAGDMLTLEDLARAWGVTSKGNMVNVLKDLRMEMDFPAHVVERNAHLYPAKASLEVLLAWETRNDEASTARQTRANEILGQTARGGVGEALHAPNELAVLNRLAADIEERERKQGIYTPTQEVGRTAADVFSLMSEFCSNLENEIDPNGLLDPTVRTALRDAGKRRLIDLHARMKDLLDADGGATERPAGRARPARARRKRS